MESRMDKYYNDENIDESRFERNREKYTELDEKDLENLDLTSNISVLGSNAENLNIDELKALLNKKYTKEEREVSVISDEDFEVDLEDTKEYDLKKILDNAHSQNKNDDYEALRRKKLKETQFEILNNLDLARKNEPEAEETLTAEETKLMNLIKTVNENSLKREKEIDLLDSLKGNDHTEVLSPVDMDMDYTDNKPTLVEELEKTIKLSRKDIDDKLETTAIEIDSSLTEEIQDIDEKFEQTEENTFYTGKFQIKDSDLNEFEKEVSRGNPLVVILVALLVLIVLAAVVYFADKFMNLGLFK